MNGQSKKRPKWKKSFYIFTFVYTIIVCIFGLTTYYLPEIYQEIENRRVEQIKQEISSSLSLPAADRTTKFEALIKKENISLAIVSNQDYEFSNMGTIEFKELNQKVNDKLLSYKGSYEKEIDGQNYQVWFAIYQMEGQRVFESLFLGLSILVLILFCSLSAIIFFIFRTLVKPIKRLKEHIVQLKAYQFLFSDDESKSVDQTDYDLLTEELAEFSHDLKDKMDNIGLKYTSLERDLQAKQERIIYKEQLVSSMVHDLKIPITITSLKLENMLEEIDSESKLSKDITTILADNEAIFGQIKDAVNMIHQEEITNKQEKIDVAEIIKESIKRFDTLFKKRGIFYHLEVPRELMVEVDLIDLRQILHNVISNISKYTVENGMFELAVFVQDGGFYLEAFNELPDEEVQSIDFDHVFDLFYRNQADDVGNGIGMYTIKSMVEKYHGTCLFEPSENGVRLSIFMPIGDDAS